MGYAVVGTDYAGLGTEGRHAYLDMLSNGTDVIHSVSAAHAAVSTLSEKWLVIGHSQGGPSSLGVAQLEGALKDPNFLGTVALAGASDLEDGINAVVRARLPVLNGLLGFWVFGAKTVYSELDLEEILTSKALAIYNASVNDGCSAASGAFTALPTDDMLLPGWKDNRYIKQFLARNQPGIKPTYGPCYSWVAARTFCLLNPPAKKSFSVFAIPECRCSGISTRASGMIQLSTGPCETNWTGLLPGLPETRPQAIVLRNDDSQNRGMAMDSKLPNAAVVGLLHEVVC
jgi:pimeloyl-ACP methyl ester carboxylesterase